MDAMRMTKIDATLKLKKSLDPPPSPQFRVEAGSAGEEEEDVGVVPVVAVGIVDDMVNESD